MLSPHKAFKKPDCVCVCVSSSLFGSIQEEVVKDAESVRNQQQQHVQQHSCTLDECFQLYTKEEQVSPKGHDLAFYRRLRILTRSIPTSLSCQVI